MVREIDLALGPNDAFDAEKRIREAAQQLGVEPDQINDLVVLRRSIDARKKDVLYRIKCAAYIDQIAEQPHFRIPEFPSVQDGKRIIIVGTGPAGLFAALKLIENGIKPILLERGKDVSTRRKDLHKLHIEHLVNPDSNYCFGEGGAGTYSDGKLYTRSKKRGDLQAVLNTLVNFGSSEDILIDAHPHIGTNKLPKIISRMRESILEAGGEVHFDTRVVDLGIDSSGIRSVTDQLGNVFESEAVILATGHSARDIFELVYAKGLSLEAKAFAMGVRIEHPQPLIDSIQYHCGTRRDKNLPAAAYSVVQQVNERGVFSFCMCPGGIIAPAMTIDRSWSGLLLEGARRLDEAENITIDVDSPKELQDKEKQPMATKRKSDLLAEALQTLIEESADIDGAAVVGVDGLVYSANVPNRSMDEDMVGAAAAAVMGLSRRSVQQLKRGDFARTLIQGDDGNIIVAGLNADTFLVSLTPKAVNLGMAFAEVRDITKRLQEIL